MHGEKQAEDRLQNQEKTAADASNKHSKRKRNASVVGKSSETKARGFELRYFVKRETVKIQRQKRRYQSRHEGNGSGDILAG